MESVSIDHSVKDFNFNCEGGKRETVLPSGRWVCERWRRLEKPQCSRYTVRARGSRRMRVLRRGEGRATNTGAGSGLRHVSRKGNVRNGVDACKHVASAVRSLGSSHPMALISLVA